MNDQVFRLTNDLIDALMEEESYKQLLTLNQKIVATEALQPLIEAFQTSKKAYETAKQYGKYHPDLNKYTKAYQAAKTRLFTHETIKAYKKAEKTFQDKLDTIASTLAQAVSKQVKFEHKYKFTHKGGGSCSTEKV